tara:strand:+ start:74152 stop:75096 length:945 start_codon:yes stop_codon:yes gene_type:complete
MRILVAGGAGFIGSNLVARLLKDGHEVIVVDNFITGKESNIKPFFDQPKFKLLKHDIRTAFDIEGSVDQIFNLASPASPIDFERIPLFILETGSIGHRHLLDIASRKKARILLASTSEVYGDPLVHPQVETYFGNVNPVGVRGCYDESKRYAEALSMAHRRENGTNICIARIFNTYGPNMRPEDGRVIPSFFSQALQKKSLTINGDGTQTRSLCFVTDLVAGLIALMNSSETGPMNIGNPEELTIVELANKINDLLGNTSPHLFLKLPENDPLKRRPDISRIKSTLNWSPGVSLSDGLKVTLDWFKKEFKIEGK